VQPCGVPHHVALAHSPIAHQLEIILAMGGNAHGQWHSLAVLYLAK